MKKLLTIIFSALYLVTLQPVFAHAQTIVGQPASMYYAPSSGSVTLNSSSNFTVDVMVNTGGANAVGVDSHVLFDKTKLQFVSGIYPGAGTGTFFPSVAFAMPSPATANASGQISMARVVLAAAEGEPRNVTNATGIFATLTFKPLVAVGSSVTLNFDFTLGGTRDCNVVGGDVAGTDILGSASPATLTIAGGTPPINETDPYIDNIIPEEGDEGEEISLIIEGRNFGTEDGHVYIGTRLAEIVEWSNTEIKVLTPAIYVSNNTQYQVKVKRADGKIATYMGFTIVDTGLAAILWMGLIPLNGAAAVLIKRRWFAKKASEAQVVPIQIVG